MLFHLPLFEICHEQHILFLEELDGQGVGGGGMLTWPKGGGALTQICKQLNMLRKGRERSIMRDIASSIDARVVSVSNHFLHRFMRLVGSSNFELACHEFKFTVHSHRKRFFILQQQKCISRWSEPLIISWRKSLFRFGASTTNGLWAFPQTY